MVMVDNFRTCSHVRYDVFHVSFLSCFVERQEDSGNEKAREAVRLGTRDKSILHRAGYEMEIVERVVEEALIQASSEELAQRPKGARRRWADVFVESCVICIFSR